jgi:hypothetical protein
MNTQNNIKIEYSDFIGKYDGVFPDGYCKTIVDYAESEINKGAGYNRLESEGMPSHKKQDMAICKQDLNAYFNNNLVQDMFFKGLNFCLQDYLTKYSPLKDTNLHSRDMKLQKTGPGEGYHIWHFENGSSDMSSRALAFMLYLNTLKEEEAGETEFFYQQKRYKPKENTLIIWPASFTHTHRGNPVFGANKYVITGWFWFN